MMILVHWRQKLQKHRILTISNNIKCTFWHAADTAPLEGLPILRCAIYDPLEGLQISKMRLAEMGV